MTDNPSAKSRARPAEIIFEVTEAVEGGYDARALGYSIYTQGEDWDDLKEMARDAVLCHFDELEAPRVIRLHLIREEAIAGIKLPRDLSGAEVARRLARHYGYRVTRSRGSHVTVTPTAGGEQHQVTVPRHRDVRIGTLDARGTECCGVPRSARADSARHPLWFM